MGKLRFSFPWISQKCIVSRVKTKQAVYTDVLVTNEVWKNRGGLFCFYGQWTNKPQLSILVYFSEIERSFTCQKHSEKFAAIFIFKDYYLVRHFLIKRVSYCCYFFWKKSIIMKLTLRFSLVGHLTWSSLFVLQAFTFNTHPDAHPFCYAWSCCQSLFIWLI